MDSFSTHRPPLELCVLVVEDEVGTQDALSTLLEMDGWKVLTAYDGAEALAALEHQIPDVVLTDYMMPNVDGLALMERMQDDPRFARIPVLLVSATDVPDLARRYARAFMRKPVDLTLLRKTLVVLASSGNGPRSN